MIAACYDMHLYCDGKSCTAGRDGQRNEGEFTGDDTGAAARKRARRKGWRLFRSGHCLCPVCVNLNAEIVT